eukprot:CAMPEP_0168286746 /NCGR_PEP_ID=MMETSP0142_2-20121227/1516_1 /TAXON_ID=44445 /ORGANISM="Pseudo-nitzschia australis, Strain 10249 10 AB" /LENGTH=44 /DNA_ID= /DNA_START= /DNA_END= /DNA_ORIENTATION=
MPPLQSRIHLEDPQSSKVPSTVHTALRARANQKKMMESGGSASA